MPSWTIKTRSSKSRKIEIFQKGLTHGFAQKLAIFPSTNIKITEIIPFTEKTNVKNRTFLVSMNVMSLDANIQQNEGTVFIRISAQPRISAHLE